jgi:hypothetical protein
MRLCLALSVLAVLSPAVASAQGAPRPAQVARPARAAKSAAAAALARELQLPQTGMSMLLPQGWSTEKTGPEAWVLLSKDEVTTLMLFSVPARDMQGAMADLEKTVSGKVKDVRLDPTKEGLVGGMAALMADGKGKVDGHEVELGLLIVLNEDRQRVLFIVGFSLPDKAQSYAEDVAGLLHSVRKLD